MNETKHAKGSDDPPLVATTKGSDDPPLVDARIDLGATAKRVSKALLHLPTYMQWQGVKLKHVEWTCAESGCTQQPADPFKDHWCTTHAVQDQKQQQQQQAAVWPVRWYLEKKTHKHDAFHRCTSPCCCRLSPAELFQQVQCANQSEFATSTLLAAVLHFWQSGSLFLGKERVEALNVVVAWVSCNEFQNPLMEMDPVAHTLDTLVARTNEDDDDDTDEEEQEGDFVGHFYLLATLANGKRWAVDLCASELGLTGSAWKMGETTTGSEVAPWLYTFPTCSTTVLASKHFVDRERSQEDRSEMQQLLKQLRKNVGRLQTTVAVTTVTEAVCPLLALCASFMLSIDTLDLGPFVIKSDKVTMEVELEQGKKIILQSLEIVEDEWETVPSWETWAGMLLVGGEHQLVIPETLVLNREWFKTFLPLHSGWKQEGKTFVYCVK